MEHAALRKALPLRQIAADLEHGARRLDRREAPARMLVRQVRHLGPRADADAQDARIGRQLGEGCIHQQVEADEDGLRPGPPRVVAGGLLVEEGLDVVLVHVVCCL